MNQIIFLNKQHRARMLQLLKETEKIQQVTGSIDTEYGTAYYLLSAYEFTYNKVKKYISASGIKFKNMLDKQDFSSGEKRIVKLAANLFNSANSDISPADLINWLDDNLFEVSMCAMWMRRKGNLNLGALVNNMVFKSPEVEE